MKKKDLIPIINALTDLEVEIARHNCFIQNSPIFMDWFQRIHNAASELNSIYKNEKKKGC